MPRTINKPSVKETAKEIKEALKNPRKTRIIKPKMLFPSGSTLLNLACSETVDGGFVLGTIVTTPGSSSGGKTILVLTAMALGFYSKWFPEHSFILDEAEEALNFDMNYLFNKKFPEALVSPPLGKSRTIQEFKANMVLLGKKGKPFIYVLDSLDSLASDEELEKEMKKALAMAKSPDHATKIAGSYGVEKAKIIGQVLRMTNNIVKNTNSLLIIVQQRRQKMNAGPFSSPWKTSGGEAPFYYSTHQIWLNKIGDIKEKDRKIGTHVRAEVRKNKITGKIRIVEFDIYTDYGIDDTSSMIEFLVKEGAWKKRNHVIDTHWDIFGTKKELAQRIEQERLTEELKEKVGIVWLDIEDELRLDRIPKF